MVTFDASRVESIEVANAELSVGPTGTLVSTSGHHAP